MLLVTYRCILSHHASVEVDCSTQTVPSNLADIGLSNTYEKILKVIYKNLARV